MIGRTRIAFGPRTSAPSWDWVGVRVARQLSADFDVAFFDDFVRVPDADIVVIVKVQPPAEFIDLARKKRSNLVYIPIDRYRSEQEIRDDAKFLEACELVLLHSEVLRPFIQEFNRRVAFIEHESRYALPSLVDFKSDGFVLWVGACEHAPHVVKWLDNHRLGAEVKLLTNYNTKNARMRAHLTAHDIGVRLHFAEGKINGHEAILWSEAAQEALMRECRAAIDIKGEDFNQATKPPTKAQQFIASGIPFGCNPDSSVALYLRGQGFGVANAADADRLFSPEYWEETRAFAPKLRARTSPEAVGQSFARHFEMLMGSISPVGG